MFVCWPEEDEGAVFESVFNKQIQAESSQYLIPSDIEQLTDTGQVNARNISQRHLFQVLACEEQLNSNQKSVHACQYM